MEYELRWTFVDHFDPLLSLKNLASWISYFIFSVSLSVKVFDVLLMELEPVCTAEQEFVQKFFDFTLVEPEVSAFLSFAKNVCVRLCLGRWVCVRVRVSVSVFL